ncbi:N-acetylmuramoyl-L-alanine amidase [Lachnospiraceae bacterium]|nr:N-acetylmuramoyl-L-alanine amidase [Lachnospiraceae bacterium]
MNDGSRLMKTAAVISLVFGVISMASLFIAATFPAENTTVKEGMLRSLTEKTEVTEEVSNRDADRIGYLTIPLPDGVGSDNISVSEEETEQRIKISISDVPAYFYHRNFFSGDMKNIRNIRYGYENQVAVIELDTDGLFVPDTLVDNGNLYVGLKEFQDVYKMIVAVDAGHGGDNEGSVAYGISEKDIVGKCTEALINELRDRDVKVYLTHDLDTDADTETRVQAASTVSADLIISLHTNADSRTRVTHGVCVMSQEENSEKIAEIEQVLAEELGFSISDKTDENVPDIVEKADCPVYFIRLGYLTNKAEAEKMAAEDFAEKAAKAVSDAILKR